MRRAVLLVLICCGGAPEPKTVADGCFNVASALCDRAAQCGTLQGTLAQCRTDGVRACCSTSTCSAPVAHCKTGRTCCADAKVPCTVGVAAQFFTDCQTAIGALSCGQLATGVQPSACTAQ